MDSYVWVEFSSQALKDNNICNRLLSVRAVGRWWNECTQKPNAKQSSWNTKDIDKNENQRKIRK
jgi:hypothetical protein